MTAFCLVQAPQPDAVRLPSLIPSSVHIHPALREQYLSHSGIPLITIPTIPRRVCTITGAYVIVSSLDTMEDSRHFMRPLQIGVALSSDPTYITSLAALGSRPSKTSGRACAGGDVALDASNWQKGLLNPVSNVDRN